MKLKMVLAFFSILFFLSLISGQVKAEELTDLDNKQDYYNDVLSLYNRGVVHGYPDSSYKPWNYVSRGQFAKMITNVLNIKKSSDSKPYFLDVNPDNEYFVAIQTLKESGIIDGFPDKTFKPHEKLTRGQMSKIVVKAFNIKIEKQLNNPFTDIKNHLEYQLYINTLYVNNITKGISTNKFGPLDYVTRGQLASFIIRAESKKNSIDTNNGNFKGIISKFENGMIIIDGNVYKINAPLKSILNIENETGLRGAEVDVTIENGVIIKLNSIVINALSSANNPVIIQGISSNVEKSKDLRVSSLAPSIPTFDGEIILNTKFVEIVGIKLNNNLVISEIVQELKVVGEFENIVTASELNSVIYGDANINNFIVDHEVNIKFQDKLLIGSFILKNTKAIINLGSDIKIVDLISTNLNWESQFLFSSNSVNQITRLNGIVLEKGSENTRPSTPSIPVVNQPNTPVDINLFNFVKEKVNDKFGFVTLNINNSGKYKVMYEHVPVGDKEVPIGNKIKPNFLEYKTNDEIHDWSDMEIIVYLVDDSGKIVKSKASRNPLYSRNKLEVLDEKVRVYLSNNIARLWKYEELKFSMIFANGEESGLLQNAKVEENEYGVFYVEFPLVVNKQIPFEYYIKSARMGYGFNFYLTNNEEILKTKLEFLKKYVEVMGMEDSPLDLNSYSDLAFIINDVLQVTVEADERNPDFAIYNNSKMGEVYYKEILKNSSRLKTPAQLKELIQTVHEPFNEGFQKYNEYFEYLQSLIRDKYFWSLPVGEQLKEKVTYEQVKKLYELIDLIPEELQMVHKNYMYNMVGQLERNFYINLENDLNELRSHSMWDKEFSDETIKIFYSHLRTLEQQIMDIRESDLIYKGIVLNDVEQIHYRLFELIEQSISNVSAELRQGEITRLHSLIQPYIETSIFAYLTEQKFRYLLDYYR